MRTEFGAADAPAILAKYPVGRLPVAEARAVAADGRRRSGLRGAQGRASRRTDATPVYLYSFEREADAVVPDLVIHGLDRNFVFGNNFGPPSNYVLNADDLRSSVRSAATGRALPRQEIRTAGTMTSPSLARVQTPERTGKGSRADTSSSTGRFARTSALREEQCDFWEPFFLGSIARRPRAGLGPPTISAALRSART